MNPTYPTPDRTKQTVNRVKDEDGVIDIGWCNGALSDGRPFRAEMWAQDGISMLTFFFSSIGLTHLTADQIRALLAEEDLATFRPGARQSVEAMPYKDDAGADMWAVNVMVGNLDHTHLDRSVPLSRY